MPWDEDTKENLINDLKEIGIKGGAPLEVDWYDRETFIQLTVRFIGDNLWDSMTYKLWEDIDVYRIKLAVIAKVRIRTHTH